MKLLNAQLADAPWPSSPARRWPCNLGTTAPKRQGKSLQSITRSVSSNKAHRHVSGSRSYVFHSDIVERLGDLNLLLRTEVGRGKLFALAQGAVDDGKVRKGWGEGDG